MELLLFHRSLENYAKWQLVKQFLPYLSKDFTDAYNAFTLATRGIWLCILVCVYPVTSTTSSIPTYVCPFSGERNLLPYLANRPVLIEIFY